MSERYSKLFSLPENLYAAGSPVVIAAGALLKDNQTGKVIAQLKMRNISQKRIKAAKVCIHPLDTVGNPLGEKVEYQYLDLSAARDEDFGQKTPVVLADAATRSFTASVEEVVFTDNSIWTATGEPWEVLNTSGSLRTIGDAELIKQFRLKYGNNCKNLPLIEKDLWYCACGELNRQGETECHRCQKSFDLLEHIDMDELRRERDSRVAAEQEQAEKEAAAARAKAKKMAQITTIVVPILVAVIVAVVLVSDMVKKNNAYNEALVLLDAGEYEESIEAFTALGSFKDCPDQIRAAKYEYALALLDAGEYDEAIDVFTALGEYKDCAKQIELATNAKIEAERIAELEKQYNHAIELLSQDSNESDNEAYWLFVELGDYKDATSYVEDFQYLLIESQRIGSDWERHYSYDDYGRITSQNGGGVYDYTYTYYDDGTYSISNGYGIDYYNSNGEQIRHIFTNGEELICEWEYSDDGMTKTCIASSDGEIRWTKKYEVDEYNNILIMDDGYRQYYYTYDEYGRLIRDETFDDGKLTLYTNYIYDEHGSLIAENGVYGQGVTGVEGSYEYICTYAYLYCPNEE